MFPLLCLLAACEDPDFRPCGDYCQPVTAGAMVVACTCPPERATLASEQAKAAALHDFGTNVTWVECQADTWPLTCRVGLKEGVPLRMFCDEAGCWSDRR